MSIKNIQKETYSYFYFMQIRKMGVFNFTLKFKKCDKKKQKYFFA